MRLFLLCIVLSVGLLLGASVGTADDPPATVTVTTTETATVVSMFQGWSARKWAHRTTYWKVKSIGLHRTLMHRTTVREALELACVVYGNCSTLKRRARCESHLYRWARNNASADSPMGILQFRPSTFASTPFRGFSIWSPYAQALAGGWMMGPAGRGGEWACR